MTRRARSVHPATRLAGAARGRPAPLILLQHVAEARWVMVAHPRPLSSIARTAVVGWANRLITACRRPGVVARTRSAGGRAAPVASRRSIPLCVLPLALLVLAHVELVGFGLMQVGRAVGHATALVVQHEVAVPVDFVLFVAFGGIALGGYVRLLILGNARSGLVVEV